MISGVFVSFRHPEASVQIRRVVIEELGSAQLLGDRDWDGQGNFSWPFRLKPPSEWFSGAHGEGYVNLCLLQPPLGV